MASRMGWMGDGVHKLMRFHAAMRCLLAAFQTRLQQTVGEVNRLRDERRRLMDVGNELRAALVKAQRAGAVGGDTGGGRSGSAAGSASSSAGPDSFASSAAAVIVAAGGDPRFHWLTSQPSSIASVGSSSHDTSSTHPSGNRHTRLVVRL